MVKKYEPYHKYYPYEEEPSLEMRESKDGRFVCLDVYNNEMARLNCQIERKNKQIYKMEKHLKEQTSNQTIFNSVWNAAKLADVYHPNRTVQSILNHAQSELGEVALEINIAEGQSYKQPGHDGIVGETLDAIGALLDIIYKINPNFTEAKLVEILNPKMDKWIEKIAEHKQNLNKIIIDI